MKFHRVPNWKDQELDDQLAGMVDRVLSGEVKERIEMNDVEGERLQDTVFRIQNAFRPATPDADMAARIQARLQVEWEETRQTHRRPFFRRSRLAVPAALLVLLLVVMALWENPAAETLSAAAGTRSPWLPWIGIVCILLIVLLALVDHRR